MYDLHRAHPIVNLRGVRESGALFATPTYAFIVCFLFMIGFGLFQRKVL